MKKVTLLFLFILLFLGKLSAQKKIGSIINYTTDNGLPQNSIKSITFDKNGYCWLATEVGMVRFDGINFKLVKSKNNKSTRCGFIIKDKKENLFAMYDFPTFCKIDVNDSNIFKVDSLKDIDLTRSGKVPNLDWIIKALRKSKINKITDKSFGNVTGIDDKKAYVFSSKSLSYFYGNQFENIPIKDLYLDDNCTLIDDKLMLWHRIKNIYTLFDNNKNVLKTVSVVGVLPKTVNKNRRLLWCENGTFIFDKNEIYKLTFKNNKLYTELIFDNLPFSDAFSIYYNKNLDKYFVGTLTNGLYVISKSLFNISKIESDESEVNVFYAQGLLNNQVFANGYLFSEKERPKRITSNGYNSNILNYKENQIWYPNNLSHHNLNIYNYKANNHKNISIGITENITSLINSKISNIAYLATDHGLAKVENMKIEWLANNIKGAIHTIREYNIDSLIVGTYDGLYFYSISKKKFYNIIPNGEFRSIYEDKYHNWWFGTYSTGYYVLKKTGLVKLPMDIGNRLESVHSFYLDKKDMLWMSTNNGLITTDIKDLLKYDPKNNSKIFYRIFDKTDGLLTNEFNGGCDPSVIQLPNGELSYPSMDGLVRFNPEKIAFPSKPNKIYLDKIFLNNLEYDLNNNLRFPKDAKQISFELSSPFYGKKDELLFEYKLGTMGNDWLNVSNNRIEFNELSDGKYDLFVRIRGNEKSEKLIEFSVASYFYQTWWFALILLLHLFLLMYFYFRFRTNQLRKGNAEMEKIVREKTHELNKANIVLESSLEKLETSESELSSLVIVQNKILNLVLHDLRSPLTFLKYLVDDAIKFNAEKKEIETTKSLHSLSEGIEEVSNFSFSFFEWINFHRNGLKPIIEKVQVSELFDKLNSLFNSLKSTNKFIFKTENIELFSDKNMIETILRNVIDNANKNTQNGKIVVTAKVKNEYVEIVVEDDGKGISETKIQQLENIISNKEDTSTLSGFGFKIIIELVQLLQGDLKIANTKKGTKVSVILPVDIFEEEN